MELIYLLTMGLEVWLGLVEIENSVLKGVHKMFRHVPERNCLDPIELLHDVKGKYCCGKQNQPCFCRRQEMFD